jgi:hypothetical protein
LLQGYLVHVLVTLEFLLIVLFIRICHEKQVSGMPGMKQSQEKLYLSLI